MGHHWDTVRGGGDVARTTRSAKLDSRTSRGKLSTGDRHQEPLADYLTLTYRRPEGGGAGVWGARLRPPGREAMQRLGNADDILEADGECVLNYSQAVATAAEWAKTKRQAWKDEAAGIVVVNVEPAKPYTVADAWLDYTKDAERRGVRGLAIYKQSYRRWIEQQLGSIEVHKLTRDQIEKWHADMAAEPRTVHRAEPKPPKRTYIRKTPLPIKELKPVAVKPTKSPEEQARARKDSANRILTILKSALNVAFDRGKVSTAPWSLVKPFKNVASQRLRFLDTKEQIKLVTACDEVDTELGQLVRGALFTGARYNELCQIIVRDFDEVGQTLFIRHGKGKGASVARHVLLTGEAVMFFHGLVKNRGKDEPMFARKNVIRTKREHLKERGAWAAYDADYSLGKAVALAQIEPVTFHELRHTYASDLVNAGIPLAMVAKQLGHVGTRMVEKHYGHLAQEAMRSALDSKLQAKGL